MNRYINSSILAVCGLFILAGCQHELKDEINESSEITFETSVIDVVSETKSTEDATVLSRYTLENDGVDSGLSLVAEVSPVWYNGESFDTKGVRVLSNEDFNQTGTFSLFEYSSGASMNSNVRFFANSGIWTSSKVMEWPGDSRTLDFYAVSPYADGRTLSSDKKVVFNSPISFNDQVDLMVAKTSVPGNSYSSVTLIFSHCLSAIKFKTASGLACSVKSISINGIYAKATFPVQTEFSTGITIDVADGTRNYTYTPDSPISVPGSDIIANGGAFLIIPQTAPSGATISAVCELDGVEMTLSANIAGQRWDRSYTYTYTITPKMNGLFYEFEDTIDEGIFTTAWLPANQTGQTGYLDYPSVTAPAGYSLLGWYDRDNNLWSNSGGKFNRQVNAGDVIYLHPKFSKNAGDPVLEAGASFNSDLKTFVTTNSDNEVVFGNWSTYGSVIGGTFASSTAKVGDGKYDKDNVRLFTKDNVTYVLAEGSYNIILNPDCKSMFKDLSTLVNIDLRGTKSSGVKEMAGMFQGCAALTRILIDSNWSTAAVTDNGNNMFASCGNLSGDWGTYVNTTHLQYAKADGTDGGYLSTTTNKYYVLNKDAAHAWVKAALGAHAVHIHFGCFDDFKGGDGTILGRTWQDNVNASGLGFSNMFFNTSVGHSGHTNQCKDAKNHHIADFFDGTVDGWVLSEGKSIMVLTGDYSGFLQGTGYSSMQSIEFVNVDISRASNFPFPDKVTTR